MHWIFEGQGLEGFQLESPSLPECAAAMCNLGDHQSSLLDAERAFADTMSASRLAGFSSGRHCARLAQHRLGLLPEAVVREGRVPVWPTGYGSISHSHSLAIAVVCKSSNSVGIDIEEVDRIAEKLWAKIFTPAELSKLDPTLAAIAFSAKESGYKAIYPIGQRYIGFHEAEIDIDPSAGEFRIRYLGKHSANKALERGEGHFTVVGGQVLTFFDIAT